MAEVTPPIFMDTNAVYSGDELALPYRDLVSEGYVTGLQVTERAAGGPNMSVDVSIGSCWVTGDSDTEAQPTYRCRTSSITNLVVSADGTNPKYVSIIAEVLDATFSGGSRLWRLRAVDGTPAGSPVVPAIPVNAIILAYILIPALDTAITNSQITDARKRAGLGGQIADPARQDYRLTGVSATPVMTADNTALTTVYLTPYKGDKISLADSSSRWREYAPGEISLAVTGRTADLPFDVFAYADGSAYDVALEFLNWTNATTRATGLTRVNGVWTKTGDVTRRYLGTIRARTGTTYSWVTQGTDAPVKLDLFNADNRIETGFMLKASTDSWAYTTATWRQAQGSVNYQVDIMVGLQEEMFSADLDVVCTNSTINIEREVGIGYDTTIAFTGLAGSNTTTVASQASTCVAKLRHQPTIGRHFYSWNEISTATGVCTWYGDNAALRLQSGLTGRWTC